MGQNYNLKIDQLLANNITEREHSSGQTQTAQDEFYATDGHVRNICFVFLDGNMVSLNYAYLVKIEYEIEENKIRMVWTTDTVTMTGIHLKPLFLDLFRHLPRIIHCKDVRYNSTAGKDEPIINELNIQSNG